MDTIFLNLNVGNFLCNCAPLRNELVPITLGQEVTYLSKFSLKLFKKLQNSKLVQTEKTYRQQNKCD